MLIIAALNVMFLMAYLYVGDMLSKLIWNKTFVHLSKRMMTAKVPIPEQDYIIRSNQFISGMVWGALALAWWHSLVWSIDFVIGR